MKPAYFPRDASGVGEGRAGISVQWIRSRGKLSIDGWHDSWCAIEGDDMSLREFFDSVGITESDCAKAWAKDEQRR